LELSDVLSTSTAFTPETAVLLVELPFPVAVCEVPAVWPPAAPVRLSKRKIIPMFRIELLFVSCE
jgi:hypothetical protein